MWKRRVNLSTELVEGYFLEDWHSPHTEGAC